jgi:hypothetical protein
MSPIRALSRRHRNIVFVGGVIVALAGIWGVLEAINGASEITTFWLFVLLGVLIVLSGFLVLVGVGTFKPAGPVRHAITGLGLLLIGAVLALSVLPESNTGVLSGGVGILPPAKVRAGFTLGLLARPQGCSDSVPVTFVADGSPAYWSDPHWATRATRERGASFVLVLPGRYEDIHVGLGPIGSEAATDPAQAEIDTHGAQRQLHMLPVKGPDVTHRDITVVEGLVGQWPATRRPLIVTALARWVTHRGIGNCNLELPALTGAASAAAVAEALTCPQLDREFAANSCTAPPADAALSPGTTALAPWLETGRGVTTVTGSNVSSSESDPQPTVVRGSPQWTCASLPGTGAVQIAQEGSAAKVVTGGDCHAVATVVASPWHRDLVLVLIGAFVAVGVHMLFQGMIEGVRARAREEAGQPTDAAGS